MITTSTETQTRGKCILINPAPPLTPLTYKIQLESLQSTVHSHSKSRRRPAGFLAYQMSASLISSLHTRLVQRVYLDKRMKVVKFLLPLVQCYVLGVIVSAET